MKKLVFLVVAFFAFSFAQAQDGIKLGFKAGGNLSSATGDDVSGEVEYKFGFHAGILVNYGVSDLVSIQPELLFSNKGWQTSDEDITVKINLNYIEIPVLAHINTGALFFELGPTLAFNVSSRVTASNGDDEESTDLKDLIGVEPETLDIGYAAGIGYKLESGLGFNLRYNGGLSKLFEDSKSHNSNFMLSLSYTLGGN